MELSVVMPCLNEAATIQTCVRKAREYLERAGIQGEVVVADNGSTDGSQQLAREAGATVISVAEKGYGNALLGGIRTASGKYVIMGDADDSYDFARLEHFVERLRSGYELVMGNRFEGGILPAAMPALHRYLGNPVLSFIGRVFYKIDNVRDFHCGLRGFDRDAILSLGLTCPGMEFASEMVVKAALRGLRITEVPTTLSRDGRQRAPHLRSWWDGWRHLRFLLLHSPRWLFFYPGILLLTTGLAGQAMLFPAPVRVGGIRLDIHTMLYCAAASILGLQMVWFAVFSKLVGMRASLLPPDERFLHYLGLFTLERGALIGGGMLVIGLALSMAAVFYWGTGGFGALEPATSMRYAIPAVTLIVAGMEIVIAAFFVALLRIASPDVRG